MLYAVGEQEAQLDLSLSPPCPRYSPNMPSQQ